MTQTKAHTRYYSRQGDGLPGVTTVLNILNKPFLVKWANNLGLQGIDSTKFRDKMANIGTITHLMILTHLTKGTLDLTEYSQQDISTAENCMLSFLEWEKTHKLDPIIVEVPLASDTYGYGGTPDFIGLINGRLELMDFKTSKAIYAESAYQLAAYRQLAKEQGHEVEHARILRIGRDENEGFEERLITRFDKEFQLFKHCLSIYNLQKEMKRG
ncbi:hypothetical protein LCGC14_0861860 [marine sediment metagenome]|uniref:PD-(D/E)XK endonuclease-like domain-containing protein n=1 Tax=marine sediment metagenome TaxID=412755 RepID=A0A0F9P740_9ZZZZ